MNICKGLSKFFLLSLFLLMSVSISEAREWTIVGPRALGMGGAGVAVADDASASYWNPAAFGFFKREDGGDYGKRGWSAVMDVGLGAQVHEDLGEEINKIMQFDYNTLNTGQITASKVSDFLQLVDELKTFDDNEDRALTVLANTGLRVQVGNFGIAGYAFGDVSAKGDLDLVNIVPITKGSPATNLITQLATPANFNNGAPIPPGGPFFFTPAERTNLINSVAALPGWTTTSATNYVDAVDFGLAQAPAGTVPADITSNVTTVAELASTAQTGGSFSDNSSRLLFKGIGIIEVPVTYGLAITDSLAVGGNIKYMKARVYNTFVPVFNTDFNNALDTAMDDYEDSQNFGIDVGVLYRFGDKLRLGLVGRNINFPKFDMKKVLPGDDDNIKEKGQVRAGVAYKPVDFITLAADVDITKNDTTISSGYKSQNLGAGVEFDILNILRLRGGAYGNLAEDDIGVVYTAGVGVKVWRFSIDVGASLSGETSKIDDHTIPKETKVELALSALF